MSDVQQAIEELVNEQVDSRIEDAVSENYEVQSLRDDISELQDKLNGDFADEVTSKVMLNLTTKLVNTLDQDYIMVKKDYLDQLQSKREEGQNWGRKPPFSLYKNMENFAKIVYLQGQVIGCLDSIAQLKKHELSLVTKRNELEDDIEKLKKEGEEV